MDTTMKTMRSVLLAPLAAITVAAASGCSAGGAMPAGDESPSVGTAASADGGGDRYVTAVNAAGFVFSFQPICVNPDGIWMFGQPSGDIAIGQSATIDMAAERGFESGANCWVNAFIELGGMHESGDNFTYNPNGGTAVYQISGATIDPSWSLLGT
jgi:hypothetical protein